MRRTLALLLIFALLSAALCGGFAEGDEPYYRIDRDDPEAWTRELDNVRLLTEGKYTLKPLSSRYGIDPSYVPSLAGMDALNISGSAQYSEQQFRQLAQTLRECAGTDPIYVVDLRLESHALVNGIALSRYARRNAANKGMTMAQVEADEQARFGSMPGTTVTAYTTGRTQQSLTLDVESWMTERELAESEGIGYFRICALDMVWPDAELIDRFIDFAKGLDMDHVWLHFHCQAGFGRTGIFMCIYDMMKNPEVSVEDIALRQAMTGSQYLLASFSPSSSTLSPSPSRTPSPDFAPPSGGNKARLLRMVYAYIQQNRSSHYAQKWSDWLPEHTVPDLDGYDVMYLPAGLTAIESEAFAGTAAQVVVVPMSCKAIRANAFDGASSLAYIIIPDQADIDIDPEAFSGTGAVVIRDLGI